MKISSSRLTLGLCIIALLASAASCLLMKNLSLGVYEHARLFAPVETANKTIAMEHVPFFLPGPTITVIKGAYLFVPFALGLSMLLILVEILVKAERPRFTTQIMVMCMWLLLTTYALSALLVPFSKLKRPEVNVPNKSIEQMVLPSPTAETSPSQSIHG